MATITGAVAGKTVVTVVAASGDGANIAATFNGISFPSIASAVATATNNSGTVTITWPSANMLVDDDLARDFVTRKLAANTALTSPITVTATTQGYLA